MNKSGGTTTSGPKLSKNPHTKISMGSSHDVFNRYDDYKAEVQSRDFTALYNFIVGRVLTIIDAVAVDQEQRKALKDLVKTTIWGTYEDLQQWLWHEEQKQYHDCNEHPPVGFPF